MALPESLFFGHLLDAESVHSRDFSRRRHMGRPIMSPWSFAWNMVLPGRVGCARLEYDGVVLFEGCPARALVTLEDTRLMTTDLRHLLRVAASLEYRFASFMEANGLGHCILGEEDLAIVRITYDDVVHIDVDAFGLGGPSITHAGKSMLQSDERF